MTKQYHPFAEPWPLMEGPAFDRLVADIRANGLRLPILTYEGQILDGRNRERACEKAGVAPRYEPAKVSTDAEALALSASLNKHRRHLDRAELAFVGDKLATLKHGRPEKTANAVFDSKPRLSLKQAAEVSGSNKSMIESARAVRTHAPELEPEVKAGTLGLRKAANMAREKAGTRRSLNNPKRKSSYPANFGDARIPFRVLKEKLTPIINNLDRYSRQKPGTIPNASISICAGQLRNLLDEWREASPTTATRLRPAQVTSPE